MDAAKNLRILLFGRNGQVGKELQRALQPLGDVVALAREDCDLADHRAVARTISSLRPNIIFNAAAFTAVDRAEKEPDLAYAINGKAPGVMAEAACRCGAALVHYSTDYIFNGRHENPYTELDPPDPINVYGSSKLAGEKAVCEACDSHLVLRTSWVYDLCGDNFITRILAQAHSMTELEVVDDQVSSPTWARFLAEETAQLVSGAGAEVKDFIQQRRGTYHLSCGCHTTRYNWACVVLALDRNREKQKARSVKPIKTSEISNHARRPAFSALDCSLVQKTFRLELPDWESVLQQAFTASPADGRLNN